MSDMLNALRQLYDQVVEGEPLDLDVIDDVILYIQSLEQIVDYYENKQGS
jgi:hypothetical protein